MAGCVDVVDPAAVDAVMNQAESTFGRLDVVSCNAGLAGYPKPALEADLRNWLRACALIWPFVIELFP